ncbi:MAG: arginine deiminase family protein, partial [Acidimicrobiales bacterium]
MTFHVDSEVGRLRQTIVHRPGLELARLSPHNIEELLFDDVMWAKKAKEEHDAFAEALREHGVHVLYFGELLAQTLELAEARDFILDRVCTPELLGPVLVSPVRSLLEDLEAEQLAEYLAGVSGIGRSGQAFLQVNGGICARELYYPTQRLGA